jgi:hypothetical protein
MLYDPKWEKPAQVDPLSVEALIAWLERQPAATVYEYCNPRDCLLCRYFRDLGYEDVSIAWDTMYHQSGEVVFPRAFHWDISNDEGQTYGAALKRARAVASRS